MPEFAPRRPTPKRHREVLLVALGVVLLAFLLEVREDQRVALRGWSQYPVPELCFARSWFGTICPGCGLTRGIIRLAHADWIAATEMHRLSVLMAVTIVIQIPYRIYCLRTGRLPFGAFAPKLFGSFLIAALFVNWVATLSIECRRCAP
jgi:uncharacterized protein DUF2752